MEKPIRMRFSPVFSFTNDLIDMTHVTVNSRMTGKWSLKIDSLHSED